MTDIRPPKDGVRAMPPGSLADAGDGKTLIGRLAPINEWAEIRSAREGHFLERHAAGAFTKTFAEGRAKILFQHGRDPQLGDKVIAEPREFGEDEQGPYYRAEVLAGLDPLVHDGLMRGLYGSSHTFQVVKEDPIVYPKAASAWNPNMLPERTIREVRVMEMGPVTWPAYLGSTTSARSLTDEFALADLTSDPARLAELVEHVEPLALPVEAAAEPHSEPVSREQDDAPAAQPPAPITPPSTPKEITPVTTEYVTRDEKAARVTELKSSISERAVAYPGVFPEDVQAIDDAENEEHDALVRDIAAWDSRQARLAAFAGNPAKTSPMYEAPVVKRTPEDIYDMGEIKKRARSFEEVETLTRENALRSLDSSRISRDGDISAFHDIVEHRDEGEEGKGEMARRVLLTGSPVYRRAFNKYLRGEKDLWTPEEARAAALAVTGTTTTGGYAVPYVFDPTIIRIGSYTAQNPFRQACRVETISNGNNWRTVTVGAVTTTYITEAGAATEQGPTFGQPTYTVQSAHAFATVSHETLQDRPDIGDELGAVFAESKATYEENQFAVGTGLTVYPLGMFTDTAYTNQDTATNDVTALVDFTTAEGALPLRFRPQAAWFMNRSTIRQLLILDTTYRYFSGAGIQYQGPQANTTGPQPASSSGGNTGLFLNGYPIWEVPSAVSTLTTDGAIIAVLCDPKSYIIVDRLGMSIEVIPNMLNGATPSFPTGQRGIYARFRNTAKPLTATAGISLSVQ